MLYSFYETRFERASGTAGEYCTEHPAAFKPSAAHRSWSHPQSTPLIKPAAKLKKKLNANR
jgi:hypothetical protein